MILGSWLPPPFDRGRRRTGETLLSDVRFCIADIDVSGTDRTSDVVKGVAWLPVLAGRFGISDVHYCTVAHTAPLAPTNECADLIQDTAGSVVVTHNVHFVRGMLERHFERLGLSFPKRTWLEITSILDGRPDREVAATSISHWSGMMKSSPRRPHDAVHDVFILAQMLLAVLSYAEESGAETLDAVLRNKKARAWLRG